MCPEGDIKTDQLVKIRAILTALERKLNTVTMEESLCVDEQIIAFKGQSGLKLYNPKKPHKCWYKCHVLTGISGFAYNLEIYSGKYYYVPLHRETDCDASGNVVIRLCQGVNEDVHHKLFF